MNKRGRFFVSALMLLVYLFVSSSSLAGLGLKTKRYQNPSKQSFLQTAWKVAKKIIPGNNPNLRFKKKYNSNYKSSTRSSSNALVKHKAFFAFPIVVVGGAIATSLYNIYYNSDLFNEDNDENKVDPDREYRDVLLDEIKGEEDPTDGELIFEMLDSDYEEELKEMSKKYWEESHGYVGDSSEYDVSSEADVEEMLAMAMYDYESDLYSDDDIYMHKTAGWMLDTGIAESIKDTSEQDGETDDGDDATVTTEKDASEQGGEADDGDNATTTVTTEDAATVTIEKVEVENLKDLKELRDSDKRNIILIIKKIEGGYSRWMPILIDLLNDGKVRELSFLRTFNDSGNRYRAGAFELFMDALKDNDSLRRLSFDRCALGGVNVVFIANMLIDNTGLEDLIIEHDTLSKASDEDLAVFENALKNSDSLKTLSLAGNVMRIRGAKLITNVIKESTSLIKVNFSGNHIGNDGVSLVSEAVATNESVEEIELRDNHIGSKGVSSLVNGLKTSKSIRKVDIGDNKLGIGGTKAICDLVISKASIESLNLDKCDMGDEKVRILSEGLRGNMTLKELKIRDNKITRVGAESLGSMLRENPLKVLDISHNQLGDEGLAIILSGLEVQGTVKSLGISHNYISINGIKKLLEWARKPFLKKLTIDDGNLYVRYGAASGRNKIDSVEAARSLFMALANNPFLDKVDLGLALQNIDFMTQDSYLYRLFLYFLTENITLQHLGIVVNDHGKKLVSLNMYLNRILRKHFPGLDIKRSRILKKWLMSLFREKPQIDEDELVREADKVLNIFYIVDLENMDMDMDMEDNGREAEAKGEDDKDNGGEVAAEGDENTIEIEPKTTHEELEEAESFYYQRLRDARKSFDDLYFDPESNLTSEDRYHLAENLFYTYQSVATNIDEILKEKGELCEEDRMKIVMDLRKKSLPFLLYCFGLDKEYYLDAKGSMRYLRKRREWLEHRKLLIAMLSEFGGLNEKDGGQAELAEQGGLLYEEFFKNDDTRKALLEVFSDLIKAHKSGGQILWWKEGDPLFTRVVYALFASDDVKYVSQSVSDKIKSKRESAKKHVDHCKLLRERIKVLKKREGVLMQRREDMIGQVNENEKIEELLESPAIKKIDKELKERTDEIMNAEHEYGEIDKKVKAIAGEINLLIKYLRDFRSSVFQPRSKNRNPNPDIDALKVMLENKFGRAIEELQSKGEEEAEWPAEIKAAKRLLNLIEVLRNLRT